ncbi:MAG: calcium-binding protein, partial [Burkholderiales bacterium]
MAKMHHTGSTAAFSRGLKYPAYGPEEQAMGWYYYLEDKHRFPFTAVCSTKRAISPLQVEDEVDVIRIAPEEECAREMFVTIRWEKG